MLFRNVQLRGPLSDLIDWRTWALPLALATFLALISIYNYLLFHVTAEMFSVVVAILLFVVAWQTYPFSKNSLLMYLGCGYFWIGILDGVHTFVFKGVSIFPISIANPATQFWIATRFLEALLLLSAPFFVDRTFSRRWIFGAFGVISAILYVLIMTGNFPNAFVEGQGLTPFKVVGEFVIIAVLATALVALIRKRASVEPRVFALLTASIIITMWAEVMFTLYVNVYGLFNLLGHIFKLFSFWLIFLAVIRRSLRDPYFELEGMVRKRTAELRSSEQLAKQAHTHLVHAVEMMTEAFSLWDANDRLVLFNKPFKELYPHVADIIQLGLSFEEMTRTSVDRSTPKKTDEESAKWVRERMERHKNPKEPFLIQTNTGKWVLINEGRTADGGYVGTRTDVTDLIEREERYRSVITTTRDGFWITDTTGRLIDVNDSYVQRSGYSSEELLSMRVTDLEEMDGEAEVTGRIQKVMRSGSDLFESQHRTKNGEVWDVEVSLSYVEIEGGLFLCFFRDITDRVRVEKALRDSEEQYREIIEGTDDLITIVDGKGRLLFVNHKAKDIFGIPPEECLGLLAFDFLHPDDRASTIAAFEGWLKDKKTSVTHENRQLSRSGRVFDMLWTANIHYDNVGEVTICRSIARNITDRKQFEVNLKESETRFRNLYEKAPLAYQSLNIDGKFIEVNQAWLDMLGYSREEVIGHDFQEFLAAENFVNNNLPHFLDAGTIELPGTEMRCKDGSTKAIHIDGKIATDTNGEFLQTHCILADVTERVLAEMTLRESEKRFRDLIEGSPEGILIHKDFKLLFANQSSANMFGYGSAKEVLELGSVLDLISPRARDLVKQRGIDRARGGSPTARYETPCIRKDGSEIWIDLMATKIDWNGEVAIQATCIDITKAKLAEDELRQSESFNKSIMDNLPIGLAVNSVDPTVDFSYMNNNFPKFYQTDREALADPDSFWDVVYEDSTFREEMKKRVLDDCASGDPERMQWEGIPIAREGKKTAFINAKNVSIPETQLMLSLVWDITERKNLEDQLSQSQKMEAVGQLTGGIAHDFNNILGILIGNLELLQDAVSGDEKALGRIERALRGAQRGADLTRNLLQFSRTETRETTQISVNEQILKMDELLVKSLTVSVNVEHHLAGDLWAVEVNAGDFQDAILNLALNARDAMPDGGNLVFETCNKVIDKDYARHNPESAAGEFVMLSVSDTGHGMTPEVRKRVLEPFFSTKEEGKGTGLGLSMVFGFVQRSKGHLKIYSEPGEGTTICIYLPRVVEKGKGSGTKELLRTDLPRGTETILIVDDEEHLVDIAISYLERLGYRTLYANDGKQALETLKENADIDLLFSDVIMPGGMDGYQLATQAMKNRPNLGVLLTSGFTKQREKFKNRDKVIYAKLTGTLLRKPYNRAELAIAIRRILDGLDKRSR